MIIGIVRVLPENTNVPTTFTIQYFLFYFNTH